MGTSLHARGLPYTQCFEALNVSRPEVVRGVHEQFLAAGCDVLETNTFGANRYRLAQHGFEARVWEINRAGVALAREVAGERAFVAASVGPTGLLLETLSERELPAIESAFREQCAALVEASVDAIVLETFRQPGELDLAARAARAVGGSEIALIACVSFDASGTTADGASPERVAERLASFEVDAIGVSCATGPAAVYDTIVRMSAPGLPRIAIPNAGLPHEVDGRLTYPVTPEQFERYARRLFEAGVAAVGGCCGTTPEHIRKAVAAARMRKMK